MRIQSQTPISNPRPLQSRPVNSASQQPSDKISLGQTPESNPTYGPSNVESNGSRQALQFLGIGVMFGGIIASTQLPSPWVGVGIIGSMCGGLALMSLANKD